MTVVFRLLYALYAAFFFAFSISILTCDFIKPLMRFGLFVFLTVAWIFIIIFVGTI